MKLILVARDHTVSELAGAAVAVAVYALSIGSRELMTRALPWLLIASVIARELSPLRFGSAPRNTSQAGWLANA